MQWAHSCGSKLKRSPISIQFKAVPKHPTAISYSIELSLKRWILFGYIIELLPVPSFVYIAVCSKLCESIICEMEPRQGWYRGPILLLSDGIVNETRMHKNLIGLLSSSVSLAHLSLEYVYTIACSWTFLKIIDQMAQFLLLSEWMRVRERESILHKVGL